MTHTKRTFALLLVLTLLLAAAPGAAAAGDIRYEVRPGARVQFETADFSMDCRDTLGVPLDYILFTELPAPEQGTLLFSGNIPVTAGTRYYRAISGNRGTIGGLSFLAAADFLGDVAVPYTATAANGESYTGTVTVTVSGTAEDAGPPAQGTVTGGILSYDSDGDAVAFRSQDFYDDAARVLSHRLNSVRFYAPDRATGRLCMDYFSPTQYTPLDADEDYSPNILSRVYFLPHGSFSGTAYVSFTGTDETGKSYLGTVAVRVTQPAVSVYFDDLLRVPWAAPSVDFLARYGVVSGTSPRIYSPSTLTKRGDFVLMLQRCFGFAGGTGFLPFSDVPANAYYAQALSAAYVQGIVRGDGDGAFRPEDPLSRQEAAVLIYRCLSFIGRIEPDTDLTALYGFSDGGDVAPYAVGAVAALVNLSVLQGDENHHLNPEGYLTRAEMACLFHKAVT